MALAQTETPLIDAMHQVASQPLAVFYLPGHKRGQGASRRLTDRLGKNVFRADVPELPEFGSLLPPTGGIQAAQVLAAEAFGAEQTWFLANGSTAGIVAAILATCGPNDKIVLPRNMHRSVISGLILSGAMPVFVTPECDRNLATCIRPKVLKFALEQHPDAKAVMVVSPTYHGICGDLSALAAITHQYNIPLLVDEAHGGHFAFHPDLPASALSSGADIAIQSTHKTLGAITQASMLHLQGDRIAPDRISNALRLVQSTSPNGILLASLDAARHQMVTEGEALLAAILHNAERVRDRLSQISALVVFEPGVKPNFKPSLEPDFKPSLEPDFKPNLEPNLETNGAIFDRTRVTIDATRLGLTGFAADEILYNDLGVAAELPEHQYLTFALTFANTHADCDRLVEAYTILAQNYRQPPLFCPAIAQPSHISIPQISPRQAYFATTETVELAQADDRISAELICPYPPGIPLLMPGEVISNERLEHLKYLRSLNANITLEGCSDPTLQTLKVLSL